MRDQAGWRRRGGSSAGPWEAVGIGPRGAAVAELELDQEHAGEHDPAAIGGEVVQDRAESAASSERTETIAGVREDKQRHVVVDCAPDEPRESPKL